MSTSILILSDWFYPGYKGGGPIRSTVNLARALKDSCIVSVATTDTDFGENAPYPAITPNHWSNGFDAAVAVYYFSGNRLTYKGLLQVITKQQPDILYLNSMFSVPFTIWPLLMVWRKQFTGKVVLAPRGMLHSGALQYKKAKKSLFLTLIRMSGLPKRIQFHATDEQEKKDIITHFGKQVAVQVIPNLPAAPVITYVPVAKQPGQLSLVFISRVQAKKNLGFLLQVLQTVQGQVQLDIFGSVEDAAYQQECNAMISLLPKDITVCWKGSLENDKVSATLQQYHFFVLPTHGENFGHAIFESFAAGRPVLISDQTPWQMLSEKNIGWDVPLADKEQWQQTLQQIVDLNDAQYQPMAKSALAFAVDYHANNTYLAQYLTLFT